MTKNIMVQGTMSSAGKSLLVAGLCRVFHQDGLQVAPFKSQNMALNSFITKEGLEMGRAQVVQAEAAGIEPSVLMNPVLLKPCSDKGSQVIVRGEPVGTMDAVSYYEYRSSLKNIITDCYSHLAERNDVIVIEGAGSPAEINLNEDDIVNMGMAELVDAPVILVADIDRGGVFAQIYGTIMLLPPEQRARIKGVIINKFRGDVEILRPGLAMIEEKTGVPVIGVLPYLNVDIDDEDSLSDRKEGGIKPVDIAVIQFPRISNATDFTPLSRQESIRLRYVRRTADFGNPDLIILPGTKSTMPDLLWMRQNGLEALVKKAAERGIPIIGVCGGYQMLGQTLSDPDHTELGGSLHGLSLLPVDTVFYSEKTRLQSTGTVCPQNGFFHSLSGTSLTGYQIHMGQSKPTAPAVPFVRFDDGTEDGVVCGNVCGTYLHGLFDGELAARVTELLLHQKGITPEESKSAILDAATFHQTQYDILANALRDHLNLDAIYQILNNGS